MRWKKFEYTAMGSLSSDDYAVSWRPLLDVIVSNKTAKFPVSALIDSGTDSTVCNADIARALHISPDTCEKVSLGGAGGKLLGFRCEVEVYIPALDYKIEMPVIFAEDPAFDMLLGQQYFFEQFKVRFEKAERSFYLAKEGK